MKYRERSPVFEAIKYDGLNDAEILEFAQGHAKRTKLNNISISNPEMPFMQAVILPGTFVVKTDYGFRLVPEDKFEKYYEAV